MKRLRLPLCPPNHRRPASASGAPLNRVPTTEDWNEYGVDLSQILLELSTWADQQILSLAIKLGAEMKQTQEKLDSEAKKRKDSSTTEAGKSFQIHLVSKSAAVNQGDISYQEANIPMEAEPCLYPITTREWWYESKRELEAHITENNKPPAEPSDDGEESVDMEIDTSQVTVIAPPAEDPTPQRLTRAQRYQAWGQQHLPQIMEAPVPRIEDHPINADAIVDTVVYYDLFLQDIDSTSGEKGRLNLLMLNYLISMLTLYYLDHVAVGGKAWQNIWTHQKQGSRMSFQQMTFMAIMHCRILRRLFCEAYHGLAYSRLSTSVPQFNWLVSQDLAIIRQFPVSTYTQSEVDQALTTLLFKFCRVEWHSQLHHYIHLLSDQMASFFYRTKDIKAFNVEGFRTPISEKLVTSLNKKDTQLNKKVQPGAQVFTYNFDFLYRCSWRYFYIMQNIMGFEQFMNRLPAQLPPPRGVWDVPFPRQQALEYPSQLSVNKVPYTRETVATLAKLIKTRIMYFYGRYSRSELNTVNEQIRKKVVDLILPQGDLEWVQHKYPIIAHNANNIMETLHTTVYKPIRLLLFPAEDHKVLDIYLKESSDDSSPLRFVHDYLVLYLFNKHMVRNLNSLNFLETYVIPQRNIHFFAKLLLNTKEPYLRQWMGRYYLYYNNHMSFVNTDIYHVLAEWVLVAFKFCPELWENIQDFGYQLLPPVLLAQNNDQFTVDLYTENAEDAMDIDSDERPPQIALEQDKDAEDKTDSLLIL